MAFDELQISNFQARTVRLYEFRRGKKAYYYNTGDRDLLISALDVITNTMIPIVWSASPMSDSGLKQKSDATSDDFTITVPSYNPIAVAFNGTPPSDLVKVIVRDVQYGDTEAPICWVGYVSSTQIKDEASCDIICNTQVAYLNRRGLRMTYQRACPHQLYDLDCKVDKTQYVEQATILNMSGSGFNIQLAVPRPDLYSGRFTNGFIEWQPDPLYTERRGILVHNADQVILLNFTDGLSNGMQVNIYPGCQRTPNNCKLFNNIANYGGFPFLPGVSPFDGNPVF